MLGTITLTVGQPDGVTVAQKEEAPETMDTIQDEVVPQVNGEKVEKESPDANDISVIEEKAAEEKPDDASEVGFKKIFRFVGFKFTLKKDKNDEKEPVKLVKVKDKDDEEVSKTTDEPAKEEEAAAAEEKSSAEEKEADTEASTAEAEVTKDDDKAETPDAPTESTSPEVTEDEVKEEEPEKEVETTPPPQETTLSPFRKLFSAAIFSTLRKKTSIKKTKEEEEKEKEAAVEEEAAKTEESAPAPVEEKKEEEKEEEKEKEEEEEKEKEVVEQESKEAAPATPEEEKTESKEEAPATPAEVKSETASEPEVTAETPAPAANTTDEIKPEEEKTEPSAEEEKAPVEVTSEAELLSSQEKAKPQGSPLKKLFTGAGLKKLSTKKQKNKKDPDAKLTESGEQAAEQLQSSTESTEAPKADSGPSSPEESGEHVLAVEMTQNESSQEQDGEVTSDGEKKKDGIIAWSSFKKLVTPKKRVKRSSESEDEAAGEKPEKSATLSSSESAPLEDKSVEEETKEEKPAEEEPQTENTEKLVSSTEEPKKKMDTSVSWEALMCMGGPKKRTRKTSDSDDDETKMEEETPAAPEAAEQEVKTEAEVATSENAECEGEVAATAEPVTSPPERESAWETLKRLILSKNKPKVEEKPEEPGEQVQSDSEAPKDESAFSLKKFLPGRRKKKAEKQISTASSGEEDSDTPAVVPLAEFDKPAEAEQEAPEEPAAEQDAPPAPVQITVSAEDRSPSWIPAIVEDVDDKHDELSDIPEEAENAATPKSVDTDAADDETDEEAIAPLKIPGRTGRRLSTAEVKPVAPAPSAETTPVPHGPKPESAEQVLGPIEAQITEIPVQTSVTVEDVPVEVATEKTEFEPPTSNADATTNTLLEPHAREEAMAICTGLGTKEIAKIALEKPAMPIVECVAVIRDALSTEVTTEEKGACAEAAIVTEDEIFSAQIHQVETTTLEPFVEKMTNNIAEVQEATESFEPEIEKVGVVSSVMDESEIVQPATLNENSPKVVLVNPITPTSEAAVCTPSVEVHEPTVETKEVIMDTEQLAAIQENTPVNEVIQAVCETTTTAIMSQKTEPATSIIEANEGMPVVTQTVVLVAPPNVESDQVATSDASETVMVLEPRLEEAVVEKTVEAAVAPDQASEKADETKEEADQTSEIEAQSMVIAQNVIQDAMVKVSDDATEAKKPKSATIPTPVQAVATTEKEFEIPAEALVITNTPVPVTCEKPTPKPLCVAMEVIDDIPVEVIETLDASGEEEKKPREGLKTAVEVNVSEEIVIVEEVEEIKEETQTDQEPEQVKEEDSEVQEPVREEAAEDEKPQSDEVKSIEEKEKVLEIHMPVQVVLQTAQVIEEPFEEEAVEEFDSNGPMANNTGAKAKSPESEKKLSTVSEEPQASAEAAVTEKTKSVKCAEVMAQVIEVIEEAVKEIEPVSTEITAAS